jgi:hypothetical protein
MKKVTFNDAPTLATFGEDLSEISQLEGWLVDEHVCVQKPDPERDWGWRVSLYPWGLRLSEDFYAWPDAEEYAQEISRLGIDWPSIYASEDFGESPEFKNARAKITEIRDRYEAQGFFRTASSADA